jgi:hypothetical protein
VERWIQPIVKEKMANMMLMNTYKK